MNLAKAPAWARELLASQPVGRLAFLDEDDRPRVLPITFALSGDVVWSAIDDKPKRSAEPARVRYLRRRPAASLLVDFYAADWTRLRWAQANGRVEVVDSALAADGLAALAAKYEQYARRSPPGPFLRLVVEQVVCWRAGDSG